MGERIQVGGWLAEPELNQLVRHDPEGGAGVVCRVEPKVMELLVYLAGRPGRTISRREILDALWGERFVVEGVLTRCVFELRQALGDDPRQARYILTVAKKGYRWIAPASENGVRPAAEPLAAPAAPRGRTLAVLPFVNMSTDADQEYLCEGIAEELTTALTRLPGLRVLARSTSFQYGGSDDRLRRIREELRVDIVIEGSVRRAGERLRIAVQLVNAADGCQLWSERYDLRMADVFAVQDQLVERVVDALELRFAPHDTERPRRTTSDLDAYHLYLKGRYHWNKRHSGGLQQGLRCFEQAVDRDPVYAGAWAGVADSLCLIGYSLYGLEPTNEAMPRARAAAERALALDDRLSAAHAALAWVRFHHDWDWDGAERDFRRAARLDPARATNSHWMALFLAAMGRSEDATVQARRARELDPLSLICNACVVAPDYYGRRFEEAEAEARRLVDLDPSFSVGRFWLGASLAALGRHHEAVAEYRAFSDSFGSAASATALLGNAIGRAGDRDGARGCLAELERRRERGFVSAYHLALVHVGLGASDEAFAHLERAFDERCDQLAYLAVEPLLDPLRPDPRFARLLGRLRLPALPPTGSRRPT